MGRSDSVTGPYVPLPLKSTHLHLTSCPTGPYSGSRELRVYVDLEDVSQERDSPFQSMVKLPEGWQLMVLDVEKQRESPQSQGHTRGTALGVSMRSALRVNRTP